MHQNDLLRKSIADIQEKLAADKTWWEGRRAGMQAELLQDLDTDGKASETGQKKTGGSDDDAVLVESGGPAQDQGGAGAKKNTKGKKGGGA